MSKTIKKALSILLCAALLFGAAPLNGFVGLHLPSLSSLFAVKAQAADPTSGTCGTNLRWSYNTSTKTLTISGTGAMSGYSSSSYNDEYVTNAPWRPYYDTMQTLVINSGVTSIGKSAFHGCTGLTSVTIGNSVTSIGERAFYNCKGLTSVTIPDSVTSIGERAFSGYTGLTSVNIGNGVISIGDYAFEGCTGLTSVTIPDSVTSIGWYAFYHCTGLTSVTIPDSVTSIGSYAFYECTGLTNVTIPGSVTSIGGSAFYRVANVVYHGSASGFPWGARAANGYVEEPLVYADSTKTNLLACPSSYRGAVTIPASVTSIGESAFYYCTGLTSVTIPDSVTSIGDYAFYCCTGLTSVTIPDSVTRIGERAFYNCNGLTSVTIPDSVTSIGDWAFWDCTGLTSVTIPDSVTSIGESAFYYCTGLTSVTIPDSVTSIGDEAFYNCKGLTSVTIPDSVTSIGSSAFYMVANVVYHGSASGSPWGARAVNGYVEEPFVYADSTKTTLLVCPSSYQGEIIIPDSVTSIGAYAFRDCTGLTSVTIPDSVTSIGDYAFFECTGLTSVTIPDSVTSIGDYAFFGCAGLTSLTIPDSVTSIGSYAFAYCTGLTSVTIPGSVKSIDSSAFYRVANVVYHGSASGSPWGARAVNGYIEKSLVYADENKTTLLACPSSYQGEIIIPDSVTSIGGSAFYYCKGLTSVTIPDGVTSIGDYAFAYCTGLTSVTIPDSVTSIGERAFYNCTGLTSVTIGNSVKSIGKYAFIDCTGLTSVTIPDSVTSIGSSAFYRVANVVYHGSASGSPWGARAVNGYVEEPFVYADSTKTTLLACPSSCSGEITIPDSVTSIGQYAFYDCTGLTSVTIPDSVTSIGNYAFSGCTGLTSVTIPDSVTSIGSSAFYWVANVVYHGSASGFTWNARAVNSYVEEPLVYADSTKTKLLACPSSYQGEITIPNSVTSISRYAFSGCTGLTSVTIPDSVTSIGYDAFYNCTGLTDVFYTGTQAQWNRISIGSNNTPLTNETLHVHVHAYDGVITKQPTCAAEGVMTYTCSSCGDSYTEPIAKLPHTPSDWIVLRQPVACTSTGLRVKMCTACGQMLEREEIPIPHAFSEWQVTNAPTCTAAGEEQRICADCGKTETRPVDALGHDYVETVIAPTCVEAGFTSHVCSRCHDTYTTDVVPATGHTCSEWMMFVDPTLTADGVMGRKCTVCGTVLDEVTVPRLAGDHVTGVALSAARVYMNRGETLTLTAAVTPNTAHNKALAWSSSHPETATVTNGTVTAVAPGLAVIIAQAEDSGDKDFCVVQVNAVTPQNGAVIENGVISGLSVNLNSLNDYLNLDDDTMTIEANSDVIGTGTKVYVMQGDTVINEFETVIFGDVDGNSWYDGTDAYFVRLVASGLIPQTVLTEAQRMAADCNHDGVIDSADVALLEQAGLLLSQVDQTLPNSGLQTNSAYLEYCSLIDQSIEITEPDQPAVTEEPAAEQGSASTVWQIIFDLFKRLVNFVTMIFSIIVIPK